MQINPLMYRHQMPSPMSGVLNPVRCNGSTGDSAGQLLNKIDPLSFAQARCDSSGRRGTNGVQHGIFQACATLLDPGDEVLLQVPYRASYPEAISLANGIQVEVRAGENEYLPGLEAIEEARTERSKILMLCSPSDPTGGLYTANRARAIGQRAVQHDIWVIADETYADLVYGHIEYASLPAYVPALADQCVLVSAPSQVYAMNNWRVAWMIGLPDVVAAATSMQSHMTSNVF